MTKEQAIEICNKIIQQNNEIVKQTRLNKDINAMQLTANCDKESLAIETVLSMLKEKDKEIKTLTQTNKSYKGIINKKDRQIDLMARTFKQDDVRTVEEIKQYFERKTYSAVF